MFTFFCSVFGWQMRKLNLNTLFLAMTCVSTPPVSGIMVSMLNSLSPYCEGTPFCPRCFPSTSSSLALLPWLGVSCINPWHCQFYHVSPLLLLGAKSSQQEPRVPGSATRCQPRSCCCCLSTGGAIPGDGHPLPVWHRATPARGFPQATFLGPLGWVL